MMPSMNVSVALGPKGQRHSTVVVFTPGRPAMCGVRVISLAFSSGILTGYQTTQADSGSPKLRRRVTAATEPRK